MRFAGALVLAVVLVAVVETRPPREKRGIKICSARDVKFMATFVCNLHKRSIRSIDAHEFELPSEADDEISLFSPSRNPVGRLPCNVNGGDCRHQIYTTGLTKSQLNHLQGWLQENGYASTSSAYPSQPMLTENGRPGVRTTENGRVKGELKTLLAGLGPIMDSVKDSVAKRDREIDWPLMTSMTLGDIRKSCCIRECRVEDFYGACS